MCGDTMADPADGACPGPPAPPAQQTPAPGSCVECDKSDAAEAAAVPGHDSGVEVLPGEYASSGAPDPLSRASSLISCGSACDDSFDILSCKNADRSDDYKGNAGDGTSEGGSESSSVTGAAPGVRRPSAATKKRVAVAEPGRPARPKPTPAPRPTQGRAPNLATRDRARSRDKAGSAEKPPPPGPKPTVVPRSRLRATPDSLALNVREPPSFKVKATKTSTARCRTPGTPPEESRGPPRLLASGPCTPRGQPADSPLGLKTRVSLDSKAAFDKYATLPRRRRENSPELAQLRRETRSTSANRETTMTRSAASAGLRRSVARDGESPPLRSLPPYPKHKLPNRIKIYHETCMQTVLLGSDVESALAGVGIAEVRTDLVPVERVDRAVQVDTRDAEVERLQQRVRLLLEANCSLQGHAEARAARLDAAEAQLQAERAEKMAAQRELQRNTERLLGLVAAGGGSGEGDSLLVLEDQIHTSASIVTKQQDEINSLHSACREMQREVETSSRAQRSLEAHLRDAEREATELQDFLQAEKASLAEGLREAEASLARAERERARARADCRATLRLAEQRRQEALALRARLQARGAPQPRLPGLAAGLAALLAALLSEHRISPEDLEDVIFHNEAFSRSASSEGCSPASPPPQPVPAAPHPVAVNKLSDDENSADLLDSETEPCLMMESVLEDVPVPDTHSQNLVSSCHSVVSCPINAIGRLAIFSKEDSCSSLQNLTTFSGDDLSPAVPDEKFVTERYQGTDLAHLDYSENDSLHNLSQAILQRQRSEAECSMSEDYAGHRETDDNQKSSSYIVDQVIIVDNLVNKLLKVLKIIHSRDKDPADVSLAQTFEAKATEEQLVESLTAEAAGLCISNTHNANVDLQSPDGERRLQFITEENICQEEGPLQEEEWNLSSSQGAICGQRCAPDGPASPRHSLSDCASNSPQPINSAA